MRADRLPLPIAALAKGDISGREVAQMPEILSPLLLWGMLGALVGNVLTIDRPLPAPIGYPTVQQRVPSLSPVGPSPSNLATTNSQLSVTTTSDNLHQSEHPIATLERPARNLLVSVHYRTSAIAAGHQATGSIEETQPDPMDSVPAGYDRGTRVKTEHRQHELGVQVWRTHSASGNRQDQQVRVMDGFPACISRGSLASFGTQSVLLLYGAPLGIEQATWHIDLSTGFCVIPRLRGDQVLLDIAPRSTRTDLRGTSIAETTAIATTLSAPLGRWVEIGRIGQGGTETHRGTLLSTQTIETVFVRVDEIAP